jgi:integrase
MAQKRILTGLTIEKAKPRPGGRYDLPDGPGGVPGLTLRVSEHGAKTFALRYRIGDRQPRLTLGRYPAMSLSAAREKARDVLEKAARGEDPAPAPAEAPEADQHTVRAMVAKYVEKRLKPRAKRWADVEAMLRLDVVAAWGDRPIAEITRRDVRDLLERILARGAPVVANRVLSHLRGLFKWAISNDYCIANPALDIDRPHDERPRQRALSDDEIRRVWQAFEAMAYPFGTLGQLLLLTAARRGEWAGASWSEIDVERALWHLPAHRSKTGEALMLPLSAKALAILETIPRIGGTALLFPSSRLTSARPISGFHKALATAQRLSGTAGWHWHDLRRTCRTGFARLGITAAVGERILNHSDGTRSRIAAVYDAHSYLPEMARALELWSHELDRLVRGGERKVVALRSAG